MKQNISNEQAFINCPSLNVDWLIYHNQEAPIEHINISKYYCQAGPLSDLFPYSISS